MLAIIESMHETPSLFVGSLNGLRDPCNLKHLSYAISKDDLKDICED